MSERLRDLEDYSRKEIDLVSYNILRIVGWVIWITGLSFLLFGLIKFLGTLSSEGSNISISLISLSINLLTIPLGCLFLITGSLSILAGRRHFV